MKDRHLISVDELRAVGALEVPPAWRKSLGRGSATGAQPDLFSGLTDDNEAGREATEPPQTEPGDEESE